MTIALLTLSVPEVFSALSVCGMACCRIDTGKDTAYAPGKCCSHVEKRPCGCSFKNPAGPDPARLPGNEISITDGQQPVFYLTAQFLYFTEPLTVTYQQRDGPIFYITCESCIFSGRAPPSV